MRSIKLRDAIFEHRVARIQISDLFAKIRIGVSRSQRHVSRETLVDLQLKRVVTIRAVVFLNPQIGELRKREQRLRARDRRRSIKRTAAGNEIAERVRNRRRQESVRRRIRRRVVAEELARNEVQVPADRQIVTVARMKFASTTIWPGSSR